MNDLISKLKNSGLIKTTSVDDTNNLKKISRLEDVFDGEWVINNLGNVFVIDDTIPYQTRHGDVNILKDVDDHFLHNLLNIRDKDTNLINNIVFMDIETSSLSFGAGSFVFLIGLCYFTEDGLHTKLLFIDTPGSEPALLLLTEQLLPDSSVVCTYNGKSFDLPFIRNRFRFHRMPYQLDRNTHIDLLHTTRRLWKNRLETCKLSEIENKILLLKRDSDEIPGWLVPQIYYDYLSSRDAASLQGVFYHNKMDVISLAALVIFLSKFSNTNGEIEYSYDEQDYFSLADLFIRNGNSNLAKVYFERGFSLLDHNQIPPVIYRKYGFLLKRLNVFQKANQNWQIAAISGDHIACIELAKYYEHREKNYAEALKWAEKAKKELINNKKYNYINRISSEIDHRISRIQRKMANHEK